MDDRTVNDFHICIIYRNLRSENAISPRYRFDREERMWHLDVDSEWAAGKILPFLLIRGENRKAVWDARFIAQRDDRHPSMSQVILRQGTEEEVKRIRTIGGEVDSMKERFLGLIKGLYGEPGDLE